MGVTGIGGFFFRAKDPQALRAWYVEHLGVGSAPYGQWETQAGPSVFAPFAADTDYFAADRQWMLNLRVDDLDGLCAAAPALLTPGGVLFVVQSVLCGVPDTVERLRLHGMKAMVVARRQEMFGRLMRDRAARLEELGLIGPSQRYEDLVVIRAVRER